MAIVKPGQVHILYSSARHFASWPGEHIFQAIQTCNGYVFRWECDGKAIKADSFRNVNDCIRAAVRMEISFEEANK